MDLDTPTDAATEWVRERRRRRPRRLGGARANIGRAARNAALRAAAAALREASEAIIAANAADLAAFDAAGGTAAFRDRLTLTPARVEAMAQGLEERRRPARPAGPHARRLDAAERLAHPPHRRADRRDRHDLRKPAQCRRRRRRRCA